MVYAGLCHLEGQPAGNDVGYPQYGNLNHPADGESTYTNRPADKANRRLRKTDK